MRVPSTVVAEDRVDSGTAKHFRQLVVWQRSMELAMLIYQVTRSFPREEIYGLTSQLRRAAVSVPSNIAEGYSRKSTKELLQFLAVTDGSLAEIETQLLMARQLEYCGTGPLNQALDLVEQCQRMLHTMQSTLRENIRQGKARD
jgi:four helix bundle protein